MRTCWVFDHPAHVRLLAPFLRGCPTSDVFVVTKRAEVLALLRASDSNLPTRQMFYVERPTGGLLNKSITSIKRISAVKKFFKNLENDGNGPVERIISVMSPLELQAAKKAGIAERWYICDTEIDHISHRLAQKSLTHAIIPTHWREDLDGGFLQNLKSQKSTVVYRLNGIHGHVHLHPVRRPSEVSDPPKVLVRRLLGDGVHDSDEVVEMSESAWEGLQVDFADEITSSEQSSISPWKLMERLSQVDGVVTQSVTLATEACLLGIPTLLVSKAQRGFLDRLEKEGYPLFRWSEKCQGEDWQKRRTEFLAGLVLTEHLDPEPWPDARAQVIEYIGLVSNEQFI